MGGHEIVELSSDVAMLRTPVRIGAAPPAPAAGKAPVALLSEVLIHADGPPGGLRSEGRQHLRAKSGWRRRTWQDPAAILTTITHEGTIMAESTLRALRSDASAIATWVRPRRCGASR